MNSMIHDEEPYYYKIYEIYGVYDQMLDHLDQEQMPQKISKFLTQSKDDELRRQMRFLTLAHRRIKKKKKKYRYIKLKKSFQSNELYIDGSQYENNVFLLFSIRQEE
ncbi:unnamed protein product [Paramecium sonneborni]|uniref:Uncharacterized protein n=1 Tax=Paramecium sonneborni TaxID=65129 RepID=A0A8S1LPF4_9CILI|nr:unnamed protein product [Paramecium sonneborni]